MMMIAKLVSLDLSSTRMHRQGCDLGSLDWTLCQDIISHAVTAANRGVCAGNGLKALGAESLSSQLPRIARLASLNIAGNDLGVAGAAFLAVALPQLSLTALDVGSEYLLAIRMHAFILLRWHSGSHVTWTSEDAGLVFNLQTCVRA
jgi:hypothetical protein